MSRKASWNKVELIEAAKKSKSIRQVLFYLRLVPAGGNYDQIQKYIALYKIDTSHFTGKAWNKGIKIGYSPRISLSEVLKDGAEIQSFKLKLRLFQEGFKTAQCEECGWAKVSEDGRIPVELDHINGKKSDNRLENIRILCPNCHSLKSTHRGKNKKRARVA